VEAGVEDAAVVCRLMLADVSFLLENSYAIVVTRRTEFVGGGEADKAAADDYDRGHYGETTADIEADITTDIEADITSDIEAELRAKGGTLTALTPAVMSASVSALKSVSMSALMSAVVSPFHTPLSRKLHRWPNESP
jgi:hypothetical protein